MAIAAIVTGQSFEDQMKQEERSPGHAYFVVCCEAKKMKRRGILGMQSIAVGPDDDEALRPPPDDLASSSSDSDSIHSSNHDLSHLRQYDCLLITRFDIREKGEKRDREWKAEWDGKALAFLVRMGMEVIPARKKWTSLPTHLFPCLDEYFDVKHMARHGFD